MPFISVITATYNSREAIGALARSLSEQTFEDFEWIIQDGGSTDGSMASVSHLTDLRIHAESKADRGIYDALNKGLDRATGNYILFMGADDVLQGPETFEKIARSIRGICPEPTAALGSAVVKGKEFVSTIGWKSLIVNTVHHQGALYSRKFFEDFRYSLRHPIVGDYESTLKLYFGKANCIRLNEIISVCGPDGISQSTSQFGLYQDMHRIRRKYISAYKSALFLVLGLANVVRRRIGN